MRATSASAQLTSCATGKRALRERTPNETSWRGAHVRLLAVALALKRVRPDMARLRDDLGALGATVVVTEEELASPAKQAEVRAALGQPRIALGLNAVGGPATTDMLKWLE